MAKTKLEREHWFIIIVVTCSIIILLCLDWLDDHVMGDFEAWSWLVQDIGYICIGAMLCLLLMLMVEALKDRLIAKYQKDLDELKKD